MVEIKSIQGEIIEYRVLRALVMIFVVIGHCSYYTIAGPSEYGGINYAKTMAINGIADTDFHRWAEIFTAFIYSFHMPLFMAISGAVFELGRQRGKYKNFFAFIRKKVQRLLIPFFCVTILYSIPIKYISGYWIYSTNISRDIFVGQILIQGNTHLWFLATLFFEFVIFELLAKIGVLSRRYSIVLLFILILFNCISENLSINLLKYIFEFGLYFYTGIVFEGYRDKINNHITSSWIRRLFILYLLVLTIYIAWLIVVPSSFWLVDQVGKIIVAFISMMIFYSIAFFAIKKGYLLGNLIAMISRRSFGIYLYSDPINYAILAIFLYAFTISGFGNDGLSLGLYVSRFLFTFGGGLLMTKVIDFLAEYLRNNEVFRASR